MKDYFQGALMGCFVGDALGMPVEGQSADNIKSTYGRLDQMQHARMGRGTYTDDTQMMIGVAESLIANKGFNGQHMAQTFWENFDIKRGYGTGTVKAMMRINKGVNWKNAGEEIFPGGSFGNGAAMRVAPICLLYHQNPNQLRKRAEESAHITHQHPLGKEGAVLQAYAVSLALRQKQVEPFSFLESLQTFTGQKDYQNQLKKVGKLLQQEVTPPDVAEALGNSSKSVESVPTAIFTFLQFTDQLEEAIVHAIHIGGDTDTIGAMAGAIAGAYKGYSYFPQKWTKPLENGEKGKEYILQTGEKLYNIHQSKFRNTSSN